MSGITSRYPFTAAQWQELEHQALFFKFMVSGLPIPPDLIFRIKGRTSQPHHIGLTCFQLGLSQSVDPEPTRCRRTDGKKWRCSRQTTGDSKYCERHMHRGKSRPRKLLQVQDSTTTTTTTTKPLQSASTGAGTQSNSNLSSVTSDMAHHHYHHHQHLFNTHSSKPEPVKDSNFMTFLGIESPDKSGKGERVMYHQFIEESPQAQAQAQARGRRERESWLNLVI